MVKQQLKFRVTIAYIFTSQFEHHTDLRHIEVTKFNSWSIFLDASNSDW